mmetsp:Transcript_11577/g.23873  ORF Transcript_11577/g.23873 Transcript_11577/m.23873 type:complete len:208 (-) Transcript_11577:137-760(-)
MVVFVIPRGRHQNIVVIVVDSIVVGAFVNDVVGVGQRDSRKAGIQYRQDDAEYRKRRGLGLPLAVFCALATSVISFVIITNLEFSKQDRTHQRQIGKHKEGSNEGSDSQGCRLVYRIAATIIIQARGALPPENHGSKHREKGRQDPRPGGRKGQGSRCDGHFWIISVFASFVIVIVVVVFIACAQCVDKCRQKGNRGKYRNDGPQRG